MSDIAPASNDHEYARASAKYSASFMSNAKWLKLFQAIISSGVKIERAEWRYIDSAAVDHNALPEDCDLLPTRFADGRFQPFEYKWIESIFIPHGFRPDPSTGYEKKQNTDQLLTAIEKVGKFPVSRSIDGIWIIAYKR